MNNRSNTVEDFEQVLKSILGKRKEEPKKSEQPWHQPQQSQPKTLQELKKEMQEALNKVKNNVKDESCICKDCLTFEKFEEILQHQGGTFDKTRFTIGGKEFQAKYWSNGVLNHIAVQPLDLQINNKIADLEKEKAVLSANFGESLKIQNELIKAQSATTKQILEIHVKIKELKDKSTNSNVV